MTIALPEVIMKRIRSATKKSPIAVFKTFEGKLDSVFASTVKTKQRLETNPSNLVGVYDNCMDPRQVLFQLTEAVELEETV